MAVTVSVTSPLMKAAVAPLRKKMKRKRRKKRKTKNEEVIKTTAKKDLVIRNFNCIISIFL